MATSRASPEGTPKDPCSGLQGGAKPSFRFEESLASEQLVGAKGVGFAPV